MTSKKIGRPRGVGLKVRDVPRPDPVLPPGEVVEFQIRNGTALVDAKWVPYLSQFSWQLDPAGYAKRGHSYRNPHTDKMHTTTVRMHTDIAQPGEGLEVDHINGIKTDNREANLRITTRLVNQRNIGQRRSNTSGYKGVQFSKQKGKFVANIYAQGRRHAVSAESAELAAQKYDELARAHHGSAARFNFPHPGERGLDGVLVPLPEDKL